MAQFNSNNNGKYQTQLIVKQASQSVVNNTSNVSVVLRVVKLSGSGYWNKDKTSSWSTNINGMKANGSFSYDFRGSSTLNLYSTTITITHNSDGAKSIGCSASVNLNNIGSASPSGNLSLSTIPRATIPKMGASSYYYGTKISINLPRASSGFTHKVWWGYPDGSWNWIGEGFTTNASWTIPLSLMNDIPTQTQQTIKIYVRTYSGDTQIGGAQATVFAAVVPNNIVPTCGSLSVYEFVGNVYNKVGKMVKGFSRARYDIGASSGAYGSTIKSYKVSGAGYNMNGVSGTSGIINQSGNVTFTATVTDSRGRTASRSTTVNVLDYSPPVIKKFTAERTDADGKPVWNGSHITTRWEIDVCSLKVNNVEKNSIGVQLYFYKGTNTTAVQYSTGHKNNTTTVSFANVSPNFDVTSSYVIEMNTQDILGSQAYKKVDVPTGQILFDMGDMNLGVGKFWEQGTLDVAGSIYQDYGNRVLGMNKDNTSFYGLQIEGGNWIRTSYKGFIPYSNDTVNGSSTIGTSTWPFKEIHAIGYYQGANKVTNIIKRDAQSNWTYILFDNGDAVCWGYSNSFQLNFGSHGSRFISTTAIGFNNFPFKMSEIREHSVNVYQQDGGYITGLTMDGYVNTNNLGKWKPLVDVKKDGMWCRLCAVVHGRWVA